MVSELVTTISTMFTGLISSITTGIREGLENLLFTPAVGSDPKTLSTFALVVFIFVGLGLVMGVITFVKRFLQNKGHA